MINKSRGQSLSEYSIFIAIILIAIVGMNIYVKRGLQARQKGEADAAWAQVTKKAMKENPGLTEEYLNKYSQYEPYYASTKSSVEMHRKVSKTVSTLKGDKIINPGKVIKDLSAKPTTVENINTEKAGAVGTELENANRIVKVEK